MNKDKKSVHDNVKKELLFELTMLSIFVIGGPIAVLFLMPQWLKDWADEHQTICHVASLMFAFGAYITHTYSLICNLQVAVHKDFDTAPVNGQTPMGRKGHMYGVCECS
jgi:hypothetical protein